jgi:hypothetical protein
MRQATTSGVESDAAHTSKLMAQAEKLREGKKAEKDAKAKRGQLSFKEKEKRKRNAGMQSSGVLKALIRRKEQFAFLIHFAQIPHAL